MTCLTCKEGEYLPNATTVVLTRGEASVIIKGVPAEVCALCGEYNLDEETTRKVLSMAEEAFSRGSEVEVRRYAA